MDTPETCITCRKPHVQHHCGVCAEPLCRACAMFLDNVTFAFKANLPEELKYNYYCQGCHETTVEPALKSYSEMLTTARGVYFFFNSRRKPVQVLKRSREDIKVEFCTDRDETILRMGFMAAEQGYNAVVEADVGCDKVRNHGWQKMNWRGLGTPAKVDADKLERQGDQDDY